MLSMLVVSTLAISIYTHVGTQVATAAAQDGYLNFQARLLTNTGALVPDGNYHIEFKLYNSLSSGTSAQGVCVGGVTDDCEWVETRTTGNLVAVKNGYISVNLGQVNNFPVNLDWSQQLYLSMRIGGDGGSASWDAEMSPRIRVTSVPYAQVAKSAAQLKVVSGANSTTLSVTAPTGTNTIALPDASGTVAVSASGNISLDGNGNITFSGTLPANSGGTGQNTTTTGDILVGGAGNTWNKLGIGGAGTCLSSNGSAVSWQACGGSSLFTDSGTFTYLTSTTDDFVLGSTTIAGASFYFDTSAGGLFLGTNESLNGSLTFYSSGAGINDAVISTNASGDLLLQAQSGAVVIGDGSGDIQFQLDNPADLLIANKSATITAAYTSSDFTFTRDLTNGNSAETNSGAVFKVEDTSTLVASTTSNYDLILGNAAPTGGSAFSGNLLRLQNGGTNQFVINSSGAVTTGTWQGTAIGAQYGGTGINTSASTGVPTISSGTWSVSSSLSAPLGGTGQSTVTTGDLLYGSAANTWGKLAAVASGSCLISQGVGTAPAWGACSSGSLFTDGGTFTYLTSTSDDLVIGANSVADASLYVDVDGGVSNTNLYVGNTSRSGVLVLSDGSGNTITINTPSISTSYTLKLPADSGASGQCLKNSSTPGELTYENCNNGSGAGGAITLDDAYEAGNQLTTSDARDVIFTLANTATDSSFIVDIQGTGNIFDVRDGGTSVFKIVDGGTITATGTANLNGGATIRGITVNNATSTDDQIATSITTGGAARYTGTITNADLTADQSYTLPNSTGTFCLSSGNCSGVGGYGDILNNGQNGTVRIGTNDATVLYLETSNTDRLSISAAGDVNIIGGTLATAGTVRLTNAGVLQNVTYNGTAISAQYGGTGINTSASTGVPTISSGTWSVSSSLSAPLGGTGQSTVTTGDLLYGSAANTWGKLAAVATGSCLISQGVGTAPIWGSCTTGGSGFTSITLAGNSGTSQTINEGDTILVEGDGSVLTSVAGATDKVTLSVVADSIGNSQLQFDTGQNLTTTSNVQFADVTATGNASIQGNTTIGNATTDRLTITSQILGTNALAFQGATDNAFTTTFAISDPTANRTVTFPDATGTVCLTSGNCAGIGGTGDILQGGNTFGTNVIIGADDAFGIELQANGVTRFSIDNLGAGLMNGALSVAGNFTVNTDKLVVNTTTGAVTVGSSASSGTITLGQASSASSTINIGAAAGNTYTQTINIGTSSTAGSTSNVTIGSTAAGTTIVQGGARLSALTTNGFVKTTGANGTLAVSSTVALGSEVSGTLGATNGGTGQSTVTTGDLLYGSAANTWGKLAAVASGSCLVSNGVGVAPSWGSCAGSVGALVQVPGSTAANTITPTAASVVGLTVNGTNNGTGATALIVNQSNAAQTGAVINMTNASGTQTNGVLINRNTAGGTTTNLLNLTNTAGTATNGLTFTGTFTNLINSTNFSVTNAGALTTASTINTNTFNATTLTFSGANPNISASTAATNLSVNAGTTGQVQIGGTSTGDILLGGGSSSTGCTITNASGAFACTSTINGATLSGGTISGGSLSATAVNGLSVSAGTISVGTWNGTAIAGAYGGTGQTTTTTGDILVGGAGNTWNKLAIGGAGTCLSSNGSAVSWSACGGGSLFTDSGTLTYLTSTTDDLALGSTTQAGAKFFFDTSAAALYLGTDNSANGSVTLYSSGAGITDATISTNATGDLLLQAQSGAVIIGDGSGNIQFQLDNPSDVLTAQKSATISAAYANTDYTFTRTLTNSNSAQTNGGAVLKVIDNSTLVASTASNYDLILGNAAPTGGSAFSGNLLKLQNGGTNQFVINNSGAVTVGSWQGTAIGAIYGGTGQTTVTTGDLLYGSAANTWGKLASVASGSCLVSNGVGVAPSWGSCGGGGSYVNFAPASAQTDTSTNSSIFINKTGASGNILQLQKGGTNALVVSNSGDVGVNSSTPESDLMVGSDGNAIRIQHGSPVWGVSVDAATVGFWARGYSFYNSSADTILGEFGGYGAANALNYLYAGASWDDTVAVFDTINKRVGINTETPGNKLSVNILTTADSLAQVAISTGATTNKGLVIQGVASQSANLLEFQNSTGAWTTRILSDGSINQIGNIGIWLGDNGINNGSDGNNAAIYTKSTGTEIIRNIADANIALKVKQQHASSTGNILQLEDTSGSVAAFNRYGHLSFTNTDGTTPIIQMASSAGGVEINGTGENYFNIFSENSIGFRIDSNNNNVAEYNFANGANTTIATLDENGVFTLGNSSQAGKLVLNDGNGQTTTLQAGDSAGGLTFTLPTTVGSANECLANSGTAGVLTFTACSAGGSYVNFTPGSVQTDSTTNNSIFINKTGGTGNILQLQKNGADSLLLTNSGNLVVTDGSTSPAGWGFEIVGKSFGMRGTTANGSPFVFSQTVQTSVDQQYGLQMQNAFSLDHASLPATVAVMRGILSAPTITNATGKTVTDAIGLEVRNFRNDDANPATIANRIGLKVREAANGTSTITNNYGIFVENLNATANTTNDYPLYLAGASNPILSVTGTGATTFRNQSNSATAFQVQNALGNSLFTVDTSASLVKIENSEGELRIRDTDNVATWTLNSGGLGDFEIGYIGATYSAMTLQSSDGSVKFQNTGNSSIAFQVLDNNSQPIIAVNTLDRTSGVSGNLLKIGNSTGTDTATTFLVLDSATANPTTNLASLNGGLFYNSTTNKLSVVENGTVKVLCNTTDLGCGSGGTGVLLAPASAQADTSTNSSIFINKTGASGNILQLQKSGSDKLVVSNDGNVGIGVTTPDTLLDVAGAISQSSNSIRNYTNVYNYSGIGAGTGTMSIVMPKGWSSTDLRIVIKGINGSNGSTWQAVIRGYNHSGSSAWIYTGSEIYGDAPFSSIRLGYNGSNVVALLGDTSTVWGDPFVTVSEVMAAYSNIDGWGSGWSASVISSEAGISGIVSANAKTAAYSSNAFLQGGNSFGTTATLGTNDSQSLVLETANVARLTVTSTGAATFSGNLTVANNTSTDSLVVGDSVVTKTFYYNFAHGVANQKIDLYFPANQGYSGSFDVSIMGNYNNGNSMGEITKKFNFGANGTGTAWLNKSHYTSVNAETSDDFAISDITWDATNSRWRIQIVHRNSNGNDIGIVVKGMDSGRSDSQYLNAMALGTVYTTDTTTFAVPTVTVPGNFGIGVSDATNKLTVNTLTTPDADVQVAISTGAAGNNGLIVQGVAGQTASLLKIEDSSGVTQSAFGATGALSTNLSIWGVGLVNVSTGNNASVAVNTTGTVISRNIADANTALNVNQLNASSTGDILRLSNSSATVMSVSQSGDALFKNSTNSATAFQVQNSSSTALFKVDTQNSRIDMNGLITGGASNNALYVQASSTSTASDQIGSDFSLNVSPSAASTRLYTSLSGFAATSSANLTNGSLYGVAGGAGSYSTSTVGNLYGGMFNVFKGSTGNVTNASALAVRVNNENATGTLSNAYGLQVFDAVNSGTITNNFGIYVNNMTTGTNRYPLYLAGASNPILSVNSNGDTTFRNQSNSSTAFQILDSTGSNILRVNSSSKGIQVGGSNLYWDSTAVTGAPQIIGINNTVLQNSTNSSQYGMQLQPVFDLSTVTGGTLGNLYSNATLADIGVAPSGSVTNAHGQVVRLNNTANANITNLYSIRIMNGSGTGVTNKYGLYVDAVSGGSSVNYPLYLKSSGSGELLSVNSTGDTIHKTSTNSTTAFQIQNASGTSLVVADTSSGNGRVGIGAAPGAYRLDVVDSQATTYVARVQNTNTANTADGLLIDLGVANASRGTGNYFVGFAGAGTVAGKIQGGANAVAYTTTGADYAEYFKANPNDLPRAGELVMVDTNNSQSVARSGSNTQTPLAGIVSTNPGFIGNGPICNIDDNDCDANYAKYNALVALNGQVPTKVNASNGPIARGDPITVSGVEGEGAKALSSGYIVGYAMEELASGNGVIQVLVRPQYHTLNVAQELQGTGLNITGNATVSGDVVTGGNITAAGNLNINGVTVLNSLTVNSDAIFNGDLIVQNITVANITVNGKIITAGNAPTAVVGLAAGTEDVLNNVSAPQVAVDGNDTSGTITIVAGANTSADELAKVTFDKPFTNKPRVVFSPANRDSAKVGAYYDASTTTNTEFSLFTDQAPQAGKTYVFTYFIVE